MDILLCVYHHLISFQEENFVISLDTCCYIFYACPSVHYKSKVCKTSFQLQSLQRCL